MTLLVFLAVLGVIVFVHELGHFVVAKLCGVYVDCFSLGFGPRLVWLTIGETEYRVSLVPLGGYVRMAGQVDLPDEDGAQDTQLYAHVPPCRRYDRKAVWQRMAIIAAGPAMNLLFALPIAFVLLVYGDLRPLESDATTVGRVLPASPAAMAGIKPGDRLLAVNGTPMTEWTQFMRIIRSRIGLTTTVCYARGPQRLSATLVPEVNMKAHYMGIGVGQMIRAQVLQVFSNTPAARAGIRQDDIVDRLVGLVSADVSYDQLIEEIRKRPSAKLVLNVRRVPAMIYAGDPTPASSGRWVTVETERAGGIEHVDLEDGNLLLPDNTAPSNFFVRAGDRILKINGRGINGRAFLPDEVPDYVRALPAGDVPVEVERIEGDVAKTRLVTNYVLRIKDIGMMGVEFGAAAQHVKYRPKDALKKSPRECWDILVLTLQSIRIVVHEKVGIKALSGPLAIAQLTGQAASRGLYDLLGLVLLLTINIGVINLVPFPVLDGGHLMFLMIEGVRRKPLPPRFLVWLQKAGIFLLLALFVYITYNDARKWIAEKDSLGLLLGKLRGFFSK